MLVYFFQHYMQYVFDIVYLHDAFLHSSPHEEFTVAEKRWLLVGVALHKVVHPAICQALRTKAGHPEPYGCLDISAAVDRVCSESVFGDDLKKAATHLRSKVRNKWGHPVMVEWIDKEHFHRCFLAMRKVVDLLPYSSPAVRERTCRRLTSFEVADSMGGATMGFAVGILLASVPGKCGDVVRDGSAPIALKLQDMIKAYSHLRFSA
ncbi:Hypp5585 [Branchiostoma lanceolatum]|uniref:Hypp5585 protein n=1 Tax=Branchiostoma lanceolatum TaxID=7740 RepID=A0A8J9YR82_BRALA|nr:Hypp5585 [Branchiostoma lanceolatum]